MHHSLNDKANGLQTSVVAIPHPTLGQEPYAVVSSMRGKSEEDIKQQVLDMFGKDYQLAGACSLKQLGVEEFSLNASGKIMKIDLQKAVLAYLKQ